VENERKLAVLRDALLQALDNPEEPVQAVPAPRKRRRVAAGA
jgi:hypothetical protein